MMKKILAGFAVAAFAVSAAGASAATYNFTRDLTIGSTGADVVALQDVLISGNYLVMPAGVSKGYFGSVTASAVAKWQAASKLPSTGYFGPMSRAKLSMVDSSDDSSSDDSDSEVKGGDGDFRQFDVIGNPSNEDVEEGETVEVLGFEFEAFRSDLKIERVDVLFAETGSDEDKPWKVLEEVLLVDEDGDEVASVDASDAGAWEEEENDEYSIRFDDIDFVAKEGDEAKLFVAVTATDDLDTDEQGSWSVELMDDGVRAINGEGIDVYEVSSDDNIDGDADEREFSLEAATEGDLDITVYDDDNDDEEVSVDEDNETDEVVLYTAMVDSQEGDNLIEELSVRLATTSGTNSAVLSDMIKTLYVFVDGKEVGSESVDDAAAATTTFDDLEIEIEEDEEVEITIVADINDQDGNYDNGDGVYVDALELDFIDAQDDDQTVFEGTNGGDISFSVDAVGIESANVSASAAGTVGTFAISFKVTAPEDEDLYIPEFAGTTTTNKGATFNIFNGSGSEVTDGAGVGTTTVAEVKVSGASKTSNHFRLTKGNSATVTVNVEIVNATPNANISRKIALESFNYRIGSTGADLEIYTAGIDSDYETNTVTIRNQD